MDKTDQIWRDQVRSELFRRTGHLPVVEWGQDPATDVAVIERLGPGHQYWLLYDFTQYSADFWSVYLTLFEDQAHLDINISTAIIITERLLGEHVFDLAVPDAWLVSFECLAQPQVAQTP